MNMNVFAQKLFAASTLLAPLRAKRSEWFDEFRSYKGQIPVCGCILLNPAQDKLVLVRNWKGTLRGPSRKASSTRASRARRARCARSSRRRDADRHASDHPGTAASDEAMLETFFGDQRWCVAALATRARAVSGGGGRADSHLAGARARAPRLPAAVSLVKRRLYIIRDVPEDFAFAPLARKEISKVAWFPLDGNGLPKNHWGVEKFLAPLRRWIKRSRKKRRSGSNADKDQPADGRRQSTSRGGPSDSTNPAGAAEPAVDGKGRRKASRRRSTAAPPRRTAAASARPRTSTTRRRRPTVAQPVGAEGSIDGRARGEDVHNVATFGASGGGVGWTVEEMFAANAKLTGRDFDAYDGNPHSFGHDCDDFNGAKRSQAFVQAQQSAQPGGTSEKELAPAFARCSRAPAAPAPRQAHSMTAACAASTRSKGPPTTTHLSIPPPFRTGRSVAWNRSKKSKLGTPASLRPCRRPSTTYPAFVDGTAHGTLEKPLPAHCITTVGPPPPPTNELFDAVVVDASATFVAPPADASLGIAPGAAADFEFDVGDILSTLSVASAQPTS